jgi:hypothetical protein
LLEEVINDRMDGLFIKYIENGSAVPIQLAVKERAHSADFLAFSQHVQYKRTKKMTFVSNFQGKSNLQSDAISYNFFVPGGCTLLTDPQMITHPFVIHVMTHSQY